MMEHIPDRGLLRQIAHEMLRVSRQWVIGAPWKSCLIEPHFKVALFQLLPDTWQTGLVGTFNLHNLRPNVRTDPNWIRTHYQWLSTVEWKRPCFMREKRTCSQELRWCLSELLR